jgi:hypothetical protein
MSPSITQGAIPRLIAIFARYVVSVDLPVSVAPTNITVIFFFPAAKVDTCWAMLRHIDVPA